MRLDGIPAIVTGGASGLGAATAELFVQNGAKVTIFDLNEEKGAAFAESIGALFVKVDTTSEESVNSGLDAAERAHGAARIMVACAGGSAGRSKTVSRGEAYPLEMFKKTIDMNIVGTFNCASKFAARCSTLEPMESGERGVIICTASIAAYEGQIGQVAYATAKGGIVSMTLVIARDLGDKGIRCNTIAPGPFATPPMAGLRQEVMDSLLSQQPFPHRLGDPAEFAHLAKSLVENTLINGTVVRIDGATRFGPR